MSRGNHRQDIFLNEVDRRDFLKTPAEDSGIGYLRTACDYAHLNPARAGLLRADERLLACPWSSFGYYLAAPTHRPRRRRVDGLPGGHGLQQDSPAAGQGFERRTEARRLWPGEEGSLKALRRGWRLDGEEFEQRQLEALNGQAGRHHFGQIRLEAGRAKAQRIISEELCRLGWQELDLASRRKRDPGELGIALRLRRETTLSVREIAARLHLGPQASASVCLLAAMRKATSGVPTQGHLEI
jgi:hypothetical protein